MYQRGTYIGSNLILFLLSYFLLKMVSVMNEPHCHKNNLHRFDKTKSELTKKIWFQERFASSKQMLSIDKMLPMLLRMNLKSMIFRRFESFRKISKKTFLVESF